jgi:hypothetical protein
MTLPAFTGSLSAPAPAVSTMVSHWAEYSSLGTVKSTLSSWALKYTMKLRSVMRSPRASRPPMP